MECSKQERILAIFLRALRGEDLYVWKLANEFGASSKSISRDINDLKAFFSNHRELVGNSELTYSHQRKCYHLNIDDFLSNKELFALIEVIIGARALPKIELLQIFDKFKKYISEESRPLLNSLVHNELLYYNEVKHDCESVQDNLWQLANCIRNQQEITIEYYRLDRTSVIHRLSPAAVMFEDCYFYLIAFPMDGDTEKPLYFRTDRIRHITVHRNRLFPEPRTFNEGLLKQRSVYMWPGKLRKIKFEYSGPSVQAVLDKLPTAKILEHNQGTYLLEAEVYGDGIKMWILSQGAWVKVLEPEELVAAIEKEIDRLFGYYDIHKRGE